MAGARPLMPFATFGPRHSFARIYEFDLWRWLPDSPERRLIEEERAAGRDVYTAVSRLTAEQGAAAVYDVVEETLRAAPGRFLLSIARALPRVFRQPSLWRPTHEGPSVFSAVVRWHGWYRGLLYWPLPLFGVFLVLLTAASWNGIGWPLTAVGFRAVVTPFVVERLFSTALLAMGTDQVGRLAMAFRPFYCLLLALAAVRLCLTVRTLTGRTASSVAEAGGTAQRSPLAP